MQKSAITQVPIAELIANRWSPRAFDTSKSVSQEQIIALCEAARWAPSCFGDEPWRFIVCQKDHAQIVKSDGWQLAFNCLSASNQTWVKNAPVLVLVCADSLFGHNQTPNRWAEYDTGAAAENLCLQASSMGLITHQMGGFNVDAAREAFKIPAQIVPMAMIAIGYEGNADLLPDDLKARELSARKRKPFNALFFSQAWNTNLESAIGIKQAIDVKP